MDTFTVAEGVGKMIIKSQIDFFEAEKSDDLAHILTLKRIITAIAFYLKLEGVTQDRISRLTEYYKQVTRVKYVNNSLDDKYRDKESYREARKEAEIFFDYIYEHEKYPR